MERTFAAGRIACIAKSIKGKTWIEIIKFFRKLINFCFSETLLASTDYSSKDEDNHSTENGSSNGDLSQHLSAVLDPNTVMAAREKSLITRAMDNVARTVAENGKEKETDGDEDAVEEESFEVEGSLIDRNLTKFQLATPSPMPTHLNVHFICETASRLLFLSIHWVRSIPAFSKLR